MEIWTGSGLRRRFLSTARAWAVDSFYLSRYVLHGDIYFSIAPGVVNAVDIQEQYTQLPVYVQD